MYQKLRPSKRQRNHKEEQAVSLVCPYPDCEKGYQAEGQLNHHIKDKHGGGSKTERKKYLRKCVLAKREGSGAPKTELVLPPNFFVFVEEEAARAQEESDYSINIHRFDQEVNQRGEWAGPEEQSQFLSTFAMEANSNQSVHIHDEPDPVEEGSVKSN